MASVLRRLLTAFRLQCDNSLTGELANAKDLRLDGILRRPWHQIHSAKPQATPCIVHDVDMTPEL